MKRIMLLTGFIIVSFTIFVFVNKENELANQNEYTFWLAYWDLDDFEKDTKSIKSEIHAVSHFAAYFNDDENLFIPESTLSSLTLKESKQDYINYLSFVNDITYHGGSSSLKDTDLLNKLFETSDKHIEDIIFLTLDHGFDGVEIDYEGIKNDMELWQDYAGFIEKLYERTKENNLFLRVVLEPSVPSKELNFVEGPEYVLMAYNLHGPGSKPGPKADKDFLLKMLEKQKEIPGELNFALSTGGFDFLSDNTVQSLNEKEAHVLIEKYDVETSRDNKSQALYFRYLDEDNIEHEVWFSDSNTLKYWISILEEHKIYKYSFWKIGGNLNFESFIK